MNLLEEVIKFAKEKHKNQKRKFSKLPYFIHPKRIAEKIKQITNNINIIATAYLHDTIEDTNATYEEINQLFGKEIADLVKELTSDNIEVKKMGKKKYLTQKMNKMSENAFLVKLVDRLDNIKDIKDGPQAFKEKYLKETHYILENLNRQINKQHALILDELRETLEKLINEYGINF